MITFAILLCLIVFLFGFRVAMWAVFACVWLFAWFVLVAA
jgi:hypothetical protein